MSIEPLSQAENRNHQQVTASATIVNSILEKRSIDGWVARVHSKKHDGSKREDSH